MISFLRPGLRANTRILGFKHTCKSVFRSYSNTVAPKEADPVVHLNWNEFFALRQRRRRLSQACSIFTGIAGLGLGWAVISNVEIDMTQKIFDLEIVWFYGLGVIMSGVLGYLAGPTVGNALFRSTLGKNLPSFVEKDVEYLRRIRANRPDARRSNYTNQLNDYYGEKVGSLAGYRKWLREANLFTRKSQKFL